MVLRSITNRMELEFARGRDDNVKFIRHVILLFHDLSSGPVCVPAAVISTSCIVRCFLKRKRRISCTVESRNALSAVHVRMLSVERNGQR